MAVLIGKDGAVKLGANAVAELDNWTLNIDIDLTKTTSFGDAWREQTGTIKSWTAKASGRLDISDTNGQVALRTAVLGGSTVSPSLFVDATHYFSGTAWAKMSIKTQTEGVAEVDFDFEGTGALTYS